MKPWTFKSVQDSDIYNATLFFEDMLVPDRPWLRPLEMKRLTLMHMHRIIGILRRCPDNEAALSAANLGKQVLARFTLMEAGDDVR